MMGEREGGKGRAGEGRAGRGGEKRRSIFTFGSISKKFPEQQVFVTHN